MPANSYVEKFGLRDRLLEEYKIVANIEQAIASVVVCQMLSNFWRDVILFPGDNQAREIYILAGENIQVIIPPSE